MTEVVIVSAVRTAIGKFQGSLQSYSAPQLGALVVREAVRRAGFEASAAAAEDKAVSRLSEIDDCIMGCVLQAGLGQAPARQAAIFAGLPPEAGALTVNQVCGSGLRAVSLAAQAIQTGDAEIVVAGGMESMSNAPYLLPQARTGYRMGNGTLVDAMINDGFGIVYNEFHMGAAAEMVAEKYEITPRRSGRLRCRVASPRRRSHCQGVVSATRFCPSRVPPAKKGEAPRASSMPTKPFVRTRPSKISRKLKPAFKEGGTVTAGNAPGVSDGAAAVVVTSADRARELGSEADGVIRAQATGWPRAGVVLVSRPSTQCAKSSRRPAGLSTRVDLFELNEAFSVQALAVIRDLGLDPLTSMFMAEQSRSGTPSAPAEQRVLVKLMYAMSATSKDRGIAALVSAVAMRSLLPSNGSDTAPNRHGRAPKTVRYRTICTVQRSLQLRMPFKSPNVNNLFLFGEPRDRLFGTASAPSLSTMDIARPDLKKKKTAPPVHLGRHWGGGSCGRSGSWFPGLSRQLPRSMRQPSGQTL